jgi:hypothetical protein
VLQADPQDRLGVIPGSAGSASRRGSWARRHGILLEEARRHFDLVLSTARRCSPDRRRIMAPLCDRILFLVRWNARGRPWRPHGLARLERRGTQGLDTVLTMCHPDAVVPMGAAQSRWCAREMSKYYAEG